MRAFPYWRLAGFYFFYFAYIGAFAPYFSLVSELDRPRRSGRFGIILALPQLVRIVAPHLWGWLADRGGRLLHVARIGSLRALSFTAACSPRKASNRCLR
jgi:PPP family 3-phenylpropionic acid transporter